jgi:hypothetical protein
MGLKEMYKRQMRGEVQVVDGEVEVNDAVIRLAAKYGSVRFQGHFSRFQIFNFISVESFGNRWNPATRLPGDERPVLLRDFFDIVRIVLESGIYLEIVCSIEGCGAMGGWERSDIDRVGVPDNK